MHGSATTPEAGTFPDGGIAHVLGRIARDLQAEGGVDQTMDAVIVAAVDTIPGAEHGGISEVNGRERRVTPRYTTDEVVTEFDRAQTETGQGPCLESALGSESLRVDDLATDPRWPEF